jgi:hypothetical protein
MRQVVRLIIAASFVVLFGSAYDELGRINAAAGSKDVIAVDVRQLRDTVGNSARGLFVGIEGDYRTEGSFVDEEEIPELLKAIDALLDVRANPTQFTNYEIRYTTHGELELTTYNTSGSFLNPSTPQIKYSVTLGRILKTSRTGLDAKDMLKLRGMFEAALTKLNATPNK